MKNDVNLKDTGVHEYAKDIRRLPGLERIAQQLISEKEMKNAREQLGVLGLKLSCNPAPRWSGSRWSREGYIGALVGGG